MVAVTILLVCMGELDFDGALISVVSRMTQASASVCLGKPSLLDPLSELGRPVLAAGEGVPSPEPARVPRPTGGGRGSGPSAPRPCHVSFPAPGWPVDMGRNKGTA